MPSQSRSAPQPHSLLWPTGTEYHVHMSKSPRCLDADCSDRSVAADVLLRQDEEEDEDEDEGDRKEDDEDEDTDNGYSE